MIYFHYFSGKSRVSYGNQQYIGQFTGTEKTFDLRVLREDTEKVVLVDKVLTLT
jgi:hypothetical protein